jgi:hypothetical protein
MRLLVLDLRVPANDAAHSERDLWRVLVAPSPRLLIFLMSMTLGIFWIGQHATEPVCSCRPKSRLNSYYLLCAVCRSRFRPRSQDGACRLLVQYFAAGAALCFFNTYYSIAAIVLVQVNYAVAPRFCWGLFSKSNPARSFCWYLLVGVQEMTEAKTKGWSFHGPCGTTKVGCNPSAALKRP